ncbi:MAG: hypothetical protein OXI66_03450 [Boseongicola sp.]|nr:hypothetical protein [Boseongicola sp.]
MNEDWDLLLSFFPLGWEALADSCMLDGESCLHQTEHIAALDNESCRT